MSRETSTLVSAFIMSERRLLLERDVGLFYGTFDVANPIPPEHFFLSTTENY